MSLNQSKNSSTLVSTLIDTTLEVGKLLQTASFEYWRQVVAASIVPLVASALWHVSRTIIQVNDEEQSLWVQMWLMQQQYAINHVRRLKLMSTKKRRQTTSRSRPEEEEKEDEGRFAPPKLVR